MRRDELLFYLHSFHFTALHAIEAAYVDYNLSSIGPLAPSQLPNVAHAHELQQILNEVTEDNFERIFKVSAFVTKQIRLRPNTALERLERHKSGANRLFIVFDFPKKYLEHLEIPLYPNWHVACFLRSYTSSSTWGHYGDNHRGVCLIFRTDRDSESDSISLNRITGYSNRGEEWNYATLTVHEVTYENTHDETDFFRSLGRLPESKIVDIWYRDAAGNMSECGSHFGEDFETWREEYWNSFYPSINKKTKDWEYEQESRLVLFSMLSDLTEKRQRKLEYKFESLEGIIFGIRTSDSDKLKVLDVLSEKCKECGRTDFQVFQAYYDHKEGKVKKYPIHVNLR